MIYCYILNTTKSCTNSCNCSTKLQHQHMANFLCLQQLLEIRILYNNCSIKCMEAYIGIGATSTLTKLYQWSFHTVGKSKVDNVALQTATELATLSDDDTSSLPPSHRTCLVLRKVHRSIISKLAWLDGGETSDHHKSEPLQLYYSLPWPFHLIIHKESFKMYNRIFNRMLSVQRASYEIH